jgi:hypothetical protein
MMMTGHKEMTMNEEQTTISASEFKAKCLDPKSGSWVWHA